MKVTYISSATVVIEHEGVRVLCDPWLTEGIQYGSWFHYPLCKHESEDFADVDWIYISHVHQDHMDPESMRRLPKHIPVLILDFEEKFVLRILQSFGFERIIELPHSQPHDLGEGLSIEIFGADDCNPQVCFREFGCMAPATGRSQQVDSLAVFKADNTVLVNNNDCPYPLARKACERILKRHGHVDMLLTGYSGASGYPQTFDYPLDEVKARASAKRAKCLRMAQSYIRQLEPRWFMPFAGQYVLGGRLSVLNDLRGMPELEELADEFAAMRIQSELVQLNEGESFDLEVGEPSAEFTPPDPLAREQHIRTLIDRSYIYDDQPNPGDMLPDVLSAQKRMWRYQQAWGYKSDWKFYFDTGEHVYRVPLDGTSATHTDRFESPFIRIFMEPALFGMIIHRQAHLNNAEGGSHFRVWRNPEHYEQMAMRMICYLQA